MNLSVLMSIYHKEKVLYFEQCLKSIYDEQILKPDEIILVKDGKLTEKLDLAIEKWQKKLGDVLKVISLENNVGLAEALNEGLKHCTCDYIARMDTDDIAMPDRFKVQLKFMKSNDIDMSSSNAILINSNNQAVGEKYIVQNVTYESLLKSCDVIHPACMFKRDFFNKYGTYNPKFKKSQDYDLWLRSAKQGAKIKNIDKPLIKFRTSDNMIARRKDEQKYNIEIKKQHLQGISYYISILPHILIQILPVTVLDIILKFKNRIGNR